MICRYEQFQGANAQLSDALNAMLIQHEEEVEPMLVVDEIDVEAGEKDLSFIDTLLGRLAGTNTLVFFTEDNDAVGFLCYQYNVALDIGVVMLFVLPAYRKQGIATQLLDALEKEYIHPKQNSCKIFTRVWSDNPFISLLEKNGFSRYGFNYHFFGDNSHAVYYQKEIIT